MPTSKHSTNRCSSDSPWSGVSPIPVQCSSRRSHSNSGRIRNSHSAHSSTSVTTIRLSETAQPARTTSSSRLNIRSNLHNLMQQRPALPAFFLPARNAGSAGAPFVSAKPIERALIQLNPMEIDKYGRIPSNRLLDIFRRLVTHNFFHVTVMR